MWNTFPRPGHEPYRWLYWNLAHPSQKVSQTKDGQSIFFKTNREKKHLISCKIISIYNTPSVCRAPPGFQSVVLVTRAPSPRIDKEYRAAMLAVSPNQPHHAPVREVHRSRSSLTSGLTSPPGSEAYYGETDSDADVAGYERQRRQKRRSPSNSTPGKPTGRTSPEGGETSEMSGYDSAPDAQIYSTLLDTRVDGNGGGLPGVARREVIYQPPAPGMWSSQTSTETSSIISSADDQGPRDGGQEEDSSFLELANVPLVSPERAKEALMLGSRSQLIPMVGPVGKPIDDELTTTYMEKAKQASKYRSGAISMVRFSTWVFTPMYKVKLMQHL